MPERHTAVNLQNAIEEVITTFFPERMPTAIVSDNAANTQLATSRITFNVPCFAHTLQLCVRSGLELLSVETLLRKARSLVGHFKHSTTATALLKAACDQHGCSSSKLIHDVPTRWGNTCDMLNQLCALRAPISSVLLSSGKATDAKLLTIREEWTLIKEMVEVLNPLTMVTENLSAESYPTISFAYPQFINLMKNVLGPSEIDSKSIQELKKALSTAIDNRLADKPELTKILTYICLLDPRIKSSVISAFTFTPRCSDLC